MSDFEVDETGFWEKYPIGTKAHSVGGGWWIKTGHNTWKWCTGDTFPRPGANVGRIEMPETTND